MKHKTLPAWAPLKATVSLLKSRAKFRTAARRRLKDQIRYRDQTIKRLQSEIARLQGLSRPQPVHNCVYPAQMMAMAVFIVLHGGSLRCAAATVGFYAELMGWKYNAPAFKTISNWVERCGLHALNLAKTISGEYVAILDASIQIGKEQLLLLLGVKAELAASLSRPLTVADVEVFGMEVQSSWTGGDVSDFLARNLQSRPGLRLKYVICDKGSNLMSALRSLALPVINDCSHVNEPGQAVVQRRRWAERALRCRWPFWLFIVGIQINVNWAKIKALSYIASQLRIEVRNFSFSA